MSYFRDLPILESSIEALKEVFRKVSNNPKILVVGVFNDNGGQRTAGIQFGKEVSEFWEIKSIDCSPATDVNNNFISDRIGRPGSPEIIDGEVKYRLKFRNINCNVKATYHTQDLKKLFSTTNKWMYWQDKLSFKLKFLHGIFEVRVQPEESTPFPDKNLDSAENCKLEVNLNMKTFAGIINKEYIMKRVNFGVKLQRDEETIDEERILVDEDWVPQLLIEETE